MGEESEERGGEEEAIGTCARIETSGRQVTKLPTSGRSLEKTIEASYPDARCAFQLTLFPSTPHLSNTIYITMFYKKSSTLAPCIRPSIDLDRSVNPVNKCPTREEADSP